MKRLLKKQDGSVVIIVALAMIMFLGILAIVADLGLLFLEKNRLSNGVDAAALAGIQELPMDKSAAIAVANDYISRNLKDLDSTQVEVYDEDKEMQVTCQKTVRFALAPVIGITSWRVKVSARARTDVVTAIKGVVPISVVKQNFVYGEQYMMKYGPEPGQGSYYRGNFGALALGGTGASNFTHNLAEGYSGVIRVGDWVSTEPGNMDGPTAQGIRSRIEADPKSTYDNVTKGSKRLVIVPVVDSLNVNGRKDVQIIGFGAFFLESTSRRGNDSYIVGRFIRYAAQGEIGSGEDFGLKAAKLIQ